MSRGQTPVSQGAAFAPRGHWCLSPNFPPPIAPRRGQTPVSQGAAFAPRGHWCLSPNLPPPAWTLAFLLLPALHAQDARQIFQESQNRGRSHSQSFQGVLDVFAANNKVSRKSWTSVRLGAYGNSKAILRFTEPPDVKGVALLIVNHPDRSSDQWMWTPNLGRDRRIALQDRSTRFFGTDFSFEDLEERDADQFDFKLTGEEPIDGAPCYRLEARPRERKISQYTLTRIWIRKDNYVPVQIESWIQDRPVRRLHQTDLEKVQNIWTPRTLEMTDLRRNSRTVMRLEKLEYNVPLKDEMFTVQALRQ